MAYRPSEGPQTYHEQGALKDYAVKPGDSLSKIAAAHKMNLKDFIALQGPGFDPKKILKIGTPLKVPEIHTVSTDDINKIRDGQVRAGEMHTQENRFDEISKASELLTGFDWGMMNTSEVDSKMPDMPIASKKPSLDDFPLASRETEFRYDSNEEKLDIGAYLSYYDAFVNGKVNPRELMTLLDSRHIPKQETLRNDSRFQKALKELIAGSPVRLGGNLGAINSPSFKPGTEINIGKIENRGASMTYTVPGDPKTYTFHLGLDGGYTEKV